jgi:hypothetical protein
MKRVFLAAIAAIAISGSRANAYSGNEWMSNCSSTTFVTACAMYARGLVDGVTLVGATPFYIPPEVIARQLVDVGMRYMNRYPEIRHNEAGRVLALAFTEAWPCSR